MHSIRAELKMDEAHGLRVLPLHLNYQRAIPKTADQQG